ncbi:MAG: hypothetical protein V2A58_18705, partial [Planctomycetota bacterium]
CIGSKRACGQLEVERAQRRLSLLRGGYSSVRVSSLCKCMVETRVLSEVLLQVPEPRRRQALGRILAEFLAASDEVQTELAFILVNHQTSTAIVLPFLIGILERSPIENKLLAICVLAQVNDMTAEAGKMLARMRFEVGVCEEYRIAALEENRLGLGLFPSCPVSEGY